MPCFGGQVCVQLLQLLPKMAMTASSNAGEQPQYVCPLIIFSL
jgi:hypothetical protein